MTPADTPSGDALRSAPSALSWAAPTFDRGRVEALIALAESQNSRAVAGLLRAYDALRSAPPPDDPTPDLVGALEQFAEYTRRLERELAEARSAPPTATPQDTECSCDDWEPETKRINAPIFTAQARNPSLTQSEAFKFKAWRFCPWCGRSARSGRPADG